MKNPEILIICKHPDILATILRLIHKREGWKATGAMSAGEAESLCSTTPVNLVLFGAGVDETEEAQLLITLPLLRPGIRFARHYGGGSGLLYGEVIQALADA